MRDLVPAVPSLPGPTGLQYEQGRLHQPWRAVVAVIECAVAFAAGWVATVAWDMGITHVVVRLVDGTELVSSRYSGSWVSAALGFGLIAALLIVDGLRQFLLATRVPK